MAQDQTVYNKRYDALLEQYNEAEERTAEIEKAIQEKEARNRQIADFIDTVESLPETVNEFQNDLWATLVDHVTVYNKKDVCFTLTYGREIKIQR